MAALHIMHIGHFVNLSKPNGSRRTYLLFEEPWWFGFQVASVGNVVFDGVFAIPERCAVMLIPPPLMPFDQPFTGDFIEGDDIESR